VVGPSGKMIRSRLLTLGRSLGKTTTRQFSTTGSKLGGHGGKWFYREEAIADKGYFLAADIAGGFMWWWIFWHLFTDFGHIVGHHEFPDVSKWTDQELGIPPDSED